MLLAPTKPAAPCHHGIFIHQYGGKPPIYMALTKVGCTMEKPAHAKFKCFRMELNSCALSMKSQLTSGTEWHNFLMMMADQFTQFSGEYNRLIAQNHASPQTTYDYCWWHVTCAYRPTEDQTSLEVSTPSLPYLHWRHRSAVRSRPPCAYILLISKRLQTPTLAPENSSPSK